MKKILYVSLAFAIIFAGCKKKSDDTAAPVTPPAPTITVEKKNRAIFFDFSEDWCPPCGAYGGPSFDSCISLEINTISLMKVYTTSNTSSLNCSIGTALKTDYAVSGIPDFYVNGTELNSGGGVYSSVSGNFNWIKGKALTFAGQPVVAGVYLAKSIESGKMNVTAKVQFFSAQAAGKDYRLAVYVVEDRIISPQQVTGSGLVNNYEHRNLLRATNATNYKGDKINTSAAITLDQKFDKSYAITLNSTWNTTKLKLIAVIWDVPASGKPTVVNTNVIY